MRGAEPRETGLQEARMTNDQAKAGWRGHYGEVEAALRAMAGVGRVVAAFNANIDAVIKVAGARIAELVAATGLDRAALDDASLPHVIRTPADLVRGLVRCFGSGIAEEWLIDDPATFEWARREVGCDRTQMGG